jgi:hypothetical protein
MMNDVLTGLRSRRRLQLLLGLLTGICFGFLLQKGQVTSYGVIIGQLMLRDLTVVRVMLTAVVTGMLLMQILRSLGLVTLHPKAGSIGMSVVGGLIFGAGFGLLGYCPGTLVGALGTGSLDAASGAVGVLVGAGLFAAVYPRLSRGILSRGDFGDITIPGLLRVNQWVVTIPVAALIALFLVLTD